MKKVLTFISLILIIAACESIPPNPLYLDTNGVTVKAHKWAKIGDEGIINEVRYTIVDIKILRDLIRSGNSYDRVCTTFIAEMNSLFENKNTSQDISSWDTSNVQNMNRMFNKNYAFNSDISNWDVNNVLSMREMFSNTTSFNQDISAWNVSSVTDMGGMFYLASAFNQDISEWDVSNVTDMSNMFSGAKSFNQDLSSWDVNKIVVGLYSYSSRDFSDNTPNWTLPKPFFK